jgi:adenine specific DNA methylase Mod
MLKQYIKWGRYQMDIGTQVIDQRVRKIIEDNPKPNLFGKDAGCNLSRVLAVWRCGIFG